MSETSHSNSNRYQLSPSKAPFKAWLFVGLFFAMGPLFGMMATVMGMAGAAYHLKSQGRAHEAHPAELAETIAWSTYATWIGFLALPIGIGIIVYAIRGMQKIDRMRD